MTRLFRIPFPHLPSSLAVRTAGVYAAGALVRFPFLSSSPPTNPPGLVLPRLLHLPRRQRLFSRRQRRLYDSRNLRGLDPVDLLCPWNARDQ
jgi:hypothetical protein